MTSLCEETMQGAPYRVDENKDAVVIRDKFGTSVVGMSRMPSMPLPQCAPGWNAVLTFCYDAVAIINELAENTKQEP